MEVCSDYMFKRETFHYSVNYLDRFLSTVHNISWKHFQLIGLTCLFIAAKMEEVYTPKLINMKQTANNIYSE